MTEQPNVALQLAAEAYEAATAGSPDPVAPDADPKPGTVRWRIATQARVVEELARLGRQRAGLIDDLQGGDHLIIKECRRGAAAGLTWPELHEALASLVEDPQEASIPAQNRLYQRSKDEASSHRTPPMDWQPVRTRTGGDDTPATAPTGPPPAPSLLDPEEAG